MRFITNIVRGAFQPIPKGRHTELGFIAGLIIQARIMLVLVVIVVALAVLGLSWGLFAVVCTHHDLTTFWRWVLRAGCN